MESVKALKVRKLYDGTLDDPLEKAIVIFDTNGILDVLRQGEEAKLARYDAQLEDCSDLYMTPGLIDAHVHVNGITIPDSAACGHMPVPELRIWAYQNAMTALRQGVTTLRDCGSEQDISLNVRNYIDRTGVGPDLLVCGGAICTTAGHYYSPENAVDGPDEMRQRIRQLQGQHVDFIKLMATTEIWPRKAGRVVGLSPDELQAAVEEAHRLNFKVVCHATFADLIRQLTRAGVDGLEHCVFATSNWDRLILDEKLCDEMLEKGVMADHTLAVNIAWLEYLEEKEKAGTLTRQEKEVDLPRERTRKDWVLEHFRFQTSRGLPSIAGSDAGFDYSDFRRGLKLSMELMAEGGMSNRAVIHAATGLPAQHFGWGDRIGTVRPGLQADLALWAQDPGQDIRALRRVKRVYKRGRLVE